MRPWRAYLAAVFAFLLCAPGSAARSASACTFVVGYHSEGGLRAALQRHDATVVRRLPALRAVEVRTSDAAGLRGDRAIRFVERAEGRASASEPALSPVDAVQGLPFEWQFGATNADRVPLWVQQAAASVTIAVVDTGADLNAPDLAAKAPTTFNVVDGKSRVKDDVGHGTFVSSLAAGSISNGEGIAGFGGEARLMVLKANRGPRSFDDVDEAAAIVWAVDHGARIVNLSLGGPETSNVERSAIDYAVAKGVLLVAAAGNGHAQGDRPEYPAALLQPVGSNGAPGIGLSVGASDRNGARASFSNMGSTISLVAPGASVLGAVAASSTLDFQRVALPGSRAGRYGYGSGTSYAAPQVAGAAALVWAANPMLTAAQVADVLRRSATGGGVWNANTGFGVLDVAGAVALAAGTTGTATPSVRLDASRRGNRLQLGWSGVGASSYRLKVSVDGGAPQVVSTGSQPSAAYTLAKGHAYAFTVDALDAGGAAVATSSPYSVATRRAQPKARTSSKR